MKLGRNDLCHCGSGKKYKSCCFETSALATPRLNEPAETASLMQRAIQRHQTGQLQEAANLYQQVLALHPENDKAHYFLGLVAFTVGDYPAAVKSLHQAIQFNPTTAAYYNLLGAAQNRQNNLTEAALNYRQAIALNPNYGDTHYNLALLLQEQGKIDEAIASYQVALSIKPTLAEARLNLGNAYQLQGRYTEAAASYQQALTIRADYVEAYYNLGLVLQNLNRPQEAIENFKRAIHLRPNYFDALKSLGNALSNLGKWGEAIKCYQQALALQTNDIEVYSKLGAALAKQQKWADALAVYQAGIKFQPSSAELYNNLASMLQEQGKLIEAVATFQKARALKPNSAEIHSNLGNALREEGAFAEAERHFQQAITLQPRLAEAHYNLGTALHDQEKLKEAIVCYEQALSLNSNYGAAHMNHSLSQLALGQFKSGWEEYTWRWAVTDGSFVKRDFPQPIWQGESLKNKTLLVWAEQGVGDQVLYASLIPKLLATGVGAIILECKPRLVPLFARSFPKIKVVSNETVDPLTATADLQFPLAELPGRFYAADADFYRHQGYLKAETKRVNRLKKRYQALGGKLIVGISWASNNKKTSPSKTLSLLEWAPILTLPGVTFVNLQYGDCRAEIEAVQQKLGVSIYQDPEIDSLVDLDAFAAQVAAMDLIISTSNTTVHIAGALNRPVWTLLPKGKGLLYYWFTNRADSPWYPSMRLFRQNQPGEWRAVITQVQTEFARLLEDHPPALAESV